MNKMVEIFWQGVNKFEETIRTDKIENAPRTNATIIPFNKS